MSSLDPITMATQLATFDVLPFQERYQMQADTYQAKINALSKVESALRTFRTAVSEMNGYGSSIIKNSATTSQDGFFSATADANSLSGSYQIFVEQVASAHQISANMPADMTADTEIPTTGEIKLAINGEEMIIDLSTVDTDGDGKATMSDLVKTINNDSTNPGVNATLVRSNGQTHLMLSSTETGDANRVSVTATGTGAAWFEDAFTAPKVITEPQDAVIWVGAKDSGLKLTSSSNTFDNVIDGVDITVTKPQTAGEAPIGLTVGPDSESTKEQLTKFIDAYNALVATFDEHTSIGGEDGTKRGALGNDPTLRSIESQLNNILRSEFGGMRLTDVGMSIDKDGKLTLDEDKFNEAQKTNSVALENMFNGEGNLLDSIDNMMEPYLKTSSGLLSSRKESLQANIDRIDDKLVQLDRKYEMSYDRYLKQFTQMNQIMTQMNQTMAMFS
ncbi:flagellar filament capping protein FliD [Enterovibrio nigricans]|uniref:Flagellar hook-associated protein 2 n=1 Tax=Enterovibrio nigricans DSM 22720 TaxID=1121868 RepID=A0A1T4UKB0_9GAMM|nr:flagellar filament capping protein FliD [Enterovibrio nigricans]SKA53036.1 flagellar hook-associated protein 2 [Enterovibrio nigricans DSM 22720]